MKRRNFCKRIVLTAAVMTVAPAIIARAVHPPANQGLLWQVKNSGQTQTYTKLTYKRIQKIVDQMNKEDMLKEDRLIVYMSKKEYGKFCRKMRNDYFHNIFLT